MTRGLYESPNKVLCAFASYCCPSKVRIPLHVLLVSLRHGSDSKGGGTKKIFF